MLKQKDLENRVYEGRHCIRFEYTIPSNPSNDKEHWIHASFKRMMDSNPNEWNMQVLIDRTRDKDTEVYNFGYIMPKDNLPLELIAATGLKYFQLYLKEEIQIKMNYDFVLGEILTGM